MKLIIWCICFISGPVFAGVLNWADLDAPHAYILATDIPIAENLVLAHGQTLLLETIGSDNAYVTYLQFHNPACTDSTLTSEMILFNPEPEDTVHDKSIGVELDKECKVLMFVEPKYFYNKSVFAD